MNRFLALGDSYTIGEGVEPAAAWPRQLVARLREHGRTIADPEILATTGWTTDELAAAIARSTPQGPFQLVTLLIGVNDQYRGRGVESFAAGFLSLLEQSIGFAGGAPSRVIVLSIPDWSVTPFAEGRDRAAIASEIDAFNDAARVQVVRRGASWVDVTDASRAMGTIPALTVADKLHPSATLYDRWVALLLPVAEAIISG